MTLDLWIEKHRPKTVDEYVWRDQRMRAKVEEWINIGGLPHLLLSGQSGTGKTSLALLLLKAMNIPDEDVMIINASRERKIEDLQDKIINFVNMWAMNSSGLKYILLDEADKLSQLAQGMLRNEMETYADMCRFIMTCNYPEKIIPPLHGRLQEMKFVTLDENDFVMRTADVLDKEGIGYDADTLYAYKELAYPDLRKCIGLIQQNVLSGVLQPPRKDDESAKDYLIEAFAMFQKGKFTDGRKLLVAKADPDEYDGIWRFLYQHLELFGDTEEQHDDALQAIRKAVIYDGQVADKEINLAACIAELAVIARRK